MGQWRVGDCCIICGNTRIQHHHIFYGTANRKISDKYGYILPLCPKHHTGVNGIHFNKGLDTYWKRQAQKHYEQNHGNRQDFIREFGRSYI